MPFVKVQKDKAYYKRYQVKYRRRREGKTDYYARKRLVIQAKNKYASPKYRLVVRCTGRRIVCQVTYSTIAGDKVLSAADSTELARYGVKGNYKNYPAAYATGLLVARRCLSKVGLADKYSGVEEPDGKVISCEFGKKKFFVEELDEERRPLRVNLDVGLARTSLGAKIFGALKGASDGGLDVPHNHKKFPGYDKDEKEYDAGVHKAQIFGENVADYMRFLEQEDEESGTKRLEEQFRVLVTAGVSADDVEGMYTEAHKLIREDPSAKHDKSNKERKKTMKIDRKKFKKAAKKPIQQRKKDIAAKLAIIAAAKGNEAVAMEEGEEEEEDDE